MLSLLVKIALIANMVFFKTLPRSVKTSFMTKGHGQGVLKSKQTDPKYLWFKHNATVYILEAMHIAEWIRFTY